MNKLNNAIQFLKSAKEYNIRKVLYTSKIKDNDAVQYAINNGFTCADYFDPRSLGYMSTGVIAEANEPVILITDGYEDYRCLLPSLTEAFYRNLPVYSVTISNQLALDYSKEIKDTVYESFTFDNCETIKDEHTIFKGILKKKKPVHINFICEVNNDGNDTFIKNMQNACIHKILVDLSKLLSENERLFINQNEFINSPAFKCKVTTNCMPESGLGILSMTLGASLANKRNKYVAIVTEKEFLVDINSLGNRHINGKLVFIVVCHEKKDVIMKFSEDLGFMSLPYKEIDRITAQLKTPIIVGVDEDEVNP